MFKVIKAIRANKIFVLASLTKKILERHENENLGQRTKERKKEFSPKTFHLETFCILAEKPRTGFETKGGASWFNYHH